MVKNLLVVKIPLVMKSLLVVKIPLVMKSLPVMYRQREGNLVCMKHLIVLL